MRLVKTFLVAFIVHLFLQSPVFPDRYSFCLVDLNQCLDDAEDMYERCKERSEEAQCQWIREFQVGHCFHEYYVCIWG